MTSQRATTTTTTVRSQTLQILFPTTDAAIADESDNGDKLAPTTTSVTAMEAGVHHEEDEEDAKNPVRHLFRSIGTKR